MKDRIIDIGLVVGLDYKNPTLDPHHEFQRYKTHPSIRPLLEGGKMISAGAKAIPEGGYFSMPRMYGEGFLIAGDSAGYLNGARLKGIHLGIKSGAMAAETAFQALLNEDYSTSQLSEYEAMFEASWAREELWKQRNFHQAFDYGQLAGLINAGLGIVTGGRGYGVMNRLEGHAGHERMERIQRYFGADHPHPPEKMKFDGVLTFDKVTDVYNGGVLHEENQPAHLLIADTEVCITRCTEEYRQSVLPLLSRAGLRAAADGGRARQGAVPQFHELLPLQDVRHHGPVSGDHMGAAGRRRRAELQEAVTCGACDWQRVEMTMPVTACCSRAL